MSRLRSMLWVPAAMVAAAVAFDVLTPPRYFASPLLVAACVVAGAIVSLRSTLAVAAAAVSVVMVMAVVQHRWGHVTGTVEIVDVAVAGLVAVGVNRLVARQRERLAAARGVAEEMQRVLLPAPPRRVAGLEVAARYQAAHAEARVGGDFYAVRETPFGVRMIVGDVRGKGLGAVATVAVLVGAFREAAGQAPDLEALARRLEEAMDRETGAAGAFDRRFATAVLAEVPPGSASLRLLNRGHPPPYLVADGRVTTLMPVEPDVPLGLRDLSPERTRVAEVPFPSGAAVLLVTDGVIEARDAHGVFYDPRDCLRALRAPYRARQAVDVVAAGVDRWVHGRAGDDQALLAIARTTADDRVTGPRTGPARTR